MATMPTVTVDFSQMRPVIRGMLAAIDALYAAAKRARQGASLAEYSFYNEQIAKAEKELQAIGGAELRSIAAELSPHSATISFFDGEPGGETRHNQREW